MLVHPLPIGMFLKSLLSAAARCGYLGAVVLFARATPRHSTANSPTSGRACTTLPVRRWQSYARCRLTRGPAACDTPWTPGGVWWPRVWRSKFRTRRSGSRGISVTISLFGPDGTKSS